MRASASALALFLAGVVGAQSQTPPLQPTGQQRTQPEQAATHQQESAADQAGTDKSPLVVKTYAQKSDWESSQQRSGAKQHAHDEGWSLFFGWATVIVAVLTAAILVIQAIFFARQAKMLRKTVKAMRKIAAEQKQDVASAIEVSRQTAKATEATEKNMREIARIQMRAYIGIKTIDLGEGPDPGTISVVIGAINTGKTPAAQVTYVCEGLMCEDLEWRPPENYAFPLIDSPRSTPFTMTGGDAQPLNIFVPKGPKERADRGEVSWFIYGDIEYFDAFNEKSSFEFCARYCPDAPNFHQAIFSIIRSKHT
jgi:hypothetical protein